MNASRRTAAIFVAGLLALLLRYDSARPADEKPSADPVAPWGLVSDARAGLQLAAAAEYIKDEDWKTAIRLLQHLLDGQQDTLARIPARAGKPERYISVRTEAERLLAALSKAGRELYQRTHGPRAAELLKQARQDKDAKLLARIAQRYRCTDAGSDALRELAQRRNRHVVPKALTLDWPVFRGNAERSAQAVGGAPSLVPTWRRSMMYDEKKNNPAAYEWLKRATDYLSKERKQPLISAFSPITVTVTRGDKKVPLLIYKNYWGVVARDLKSGEIVWASPSSWSLERMLHLHAEGRKVSAMTNWLQYYVDQKQYPQILFENSTVGTLSTDGRFVYVVEDLAVPPPPTGNVNMGFNPGMNNSAKNHAPKDEKPKDEKPKDEKPKDEKEDRVRSMLEIRVAPEALPKGRRSSEWQNLLRGEDDTRYGAEIQDAIQHSRLQTFELKTNGKLTWELGNPEAKGPLADCYFLGPPLPLDGLLYLLVEKEQKLSLVCLDPAAKGKLVSMLSLARMPQPLAKEPIRRTQAAHLAYRDGILVCPSNAGILLGVDLRENRLVWAYPYREKNDAPQPELRFDRFGRLFQPIANQSPWKASAPVISDSKVVDTPPNAASLQCLNLRDGSLLWSHKKKDDDLYLGGIFDGKVLIVGKKSVQGLSLASGATLWTLETGLPSGQGIANKDVYYLPLKEAMPSKRPEICAIDMRKGKIVAHLRSRPRTVGGDDYDVPGNLLFCADEVVSLTPSEIVAYPSLQVQIARMNAALATNLNDPRGLAERAALRLDSGALPGAIEDLRNALKNKPDRDARRRARCLLFEALTLLFQRDLRDADKHLQEYEELCKDGEAAEQARRRVSYLLIVARLRESQGRLNDALQAYLDLGALGPGDELLPAPDDPAVKVRRDVWVRGRIAELLKRATPQQRKQLEEELKRRLKDAQGRKDVQALRDFLAVYGDGTAAGREASLLLAERLMHQNKYLEAELRLQALRRQRDDPVHAARALEMLGRLVTIQGLLPDAVYYYRILRRDFGKTGAAVWDALSTDKRLLPFLDESNPFATGKLKARKEVGYFATPRPVFQLEHDGELLPFFRHRLAGLDVHDDTFRMADPDTGEELWQTDLSAGKFHLLRREMMWPAGTPDSALRFWYHTVGSLVVVPVGPAVFALDPVRLRLLWQKDVTAPDGRTSPANPSNAKPNPFDRVSVDAAGGLRISYPDGWSQFIGRNLVLTPSVLCLVTREGLQSFDPLTGRLVWARSDVSARSRIFGDEEYVCVVEEDADGAAASAHVLRLSDGGRVQAPVFADFFTRRVQILGRTLLLSEKDDQGAVTLRLYDVPSGADVWKHTYRRGAIVLHSEDAHFTGVVEPDGEVHVVDLRRRKEVMTGKLSDPKKDLHKVETIHLLADRENFYLACHFPFDASAKRYFDVSSNLSAHLGLRDLPVNGLLCAFQKATGDLSWYVWTRNQMLVLDQFLESPVILLTSGRKEAVPGGDYGAAFFSAMSIEKRSGRLLFVDDTIKNATPFHALRIHPREGMIDFLSPTLKITHSLASGRPAGAK